MNGVNIDDNWIKLVTKIALSQGVGWFFAGWIIYIGSVQLPTVARQIQDAFIQQGNRFATDLKTISENNIKAADIRMNMTTETLKAFREDEVEDRRLFVEILKRSDISQQDLREAVEAAEGLNKQKLLEIPE